MTTGRDGRKSWDLLTADDTAARVLVTLPLCQSLSNKNPVDGSCHILAGFQP
jgi:hypothetical protein